MKIDSSKIPPVVGLILFAAAIVFLNHELRNYNIHDVIHQATSIQPYRIFFAFIFTCGSYLTLTLFDMLAFRYIERSMPYPQIALASYNAYAFSNNTGFTLLSGGSMRYRIYSAWGLSGIEITKVVMFCALTQFSGLIFMGGITLSSSKAANIFTTTMPGTYIRLLGILLILLTMAYLAGSYFFTRPVTVGAWNWRLPQTSLSFSQILISSTDWIFSAAALYILLPTHGLKFLTFLVFFLLAQFAGILSQIPGGLGVFETVILFFLKNYMPASEGLGILIIYRIIYYIIPFLISILFLAWQEINLQRKLIGRITQKISDWLPKIVPPVLSISILFAGGVLLFTNSLPAEIVRLKWLNELLPLSVIEVSHFLASITGGLLLILALGIQRRLNSAYILAVFALIAGILLSLLKGANYKEAILLAIILAALIPCNHSFYRKAAMLEQRFNLGWMITIALIVGSSLWLGFFSFKHVEYSNELWWKFSIKGGAPRYLRAMVGGVGTLLIYGFLRLMKVSHEPDFIKNEEEKDRVKEIVMNNTSTDACLALVGDKKIFFNEAKNAFIMFAVEGNNWIAMGDPVGPVDEMDELLWNFRDKCEYYNSTPVFYEVRETYTSKYIDLGLTLLKLGEEARVKLSEFSLAGGKRKLMRYHYHKIQKRGYTFEMLSASQVPAVIGELKQISDLWLREKNTGEKGFSLGYFDEAYLASTPCALLRHEGKIAAFANIWQTNISDELSFDLMRYRPGTPNGLMDYLFLELIFWGQENGYEWLNFGMAPLSGLQHAEFAPAWNKLGNLIYRHGDFFYNFKGLRHYKKKFNPVWESRYIACPGGLKLPLVFKNVTTLISNAGK
jgi:phosphatidylglycerol lysyltransferase